MCFYTQCDTSRVSDRELNHIIVRCRLLFVTFISFIDPGLQKKFQRNSSNLSSYAPAKKHTRLEQEPQKTK